MFSRTAFLWLLAGCGASNPCVEYCKRLDAWLDECGTTWQAEFDGEMDSLDACYDHYWEAETSTENSCRQDAKRLNTQECY